MAASQTNMPPNIGIAPSRLIGMIVLPALLLVSNYGYLVSLWDYIWHRVRTTQVRGERTPHSRKTRLHALGLSLICSVAAALRRLGLRTFSSKLRLSELPRPRSLRTVDKRGPRLNDEPRFAGLGVIAARGERWAAFEILPGRLLVHAGLSSGCADSVGSRERFHARPSK